MATKFNVLITGGAGYLGSILVPALLDREYRVTVLDTFRDDTVPLAASAFNPRFTAVRGDARDEQLVTNLVSSHDVLIPLAALVGAPLCAQDELAAKTINYDAVALLLRHSGVDQRVLYPTTNSGYGIGETDAYCDETTPLRPISLYGRTKVDAERAVLDSGNGVTMRLATVFGMAPKMRLDLMVNDFVYRAVNDRALVLFEGHFRRNFIHVRDVAKAFLHCLDRYETMNNEPYNVGLSDANLTKVELCERIKTRVPGFEYVEAAIGEDQDKRDYLVSNAKIEATGFQPDHSLDDGIDELVKGMQMVRARRFSNV